MRGSIADLLRQAAEPLRRAGIDNPGLEARLLLAHALNLSPEALLRQRDRVIDGAEVAALVGRRVGGEPLAFIVGSKEFWSLRLAVSPATLIPRPDSETLIEAALDAMPRACVRSVLDLGTGTGCLLLAALTEFTAAWGLGIDASFAASRLAAHNAAATGLAARASVICGDWAAACDAQFDLVLCNPPYIATADIPGLMVEVAAHEPAGALDGGADGLDGYRHVLPQIARVLAPSGIAVVELGHGQSGAVIDLARAAGLDRQALRHDLGGIARALVLRQGSAIKKPFGDTRSGG